MRGWGGVHLGCRAIQRSPPLSLPPPGQSIMHAAASLRRQLTTGLMYLVLSTLLGAFIRMVRSQLRGGEGQPGVQGIRGTACWAQVAAGMQVDPGQRIWNPNAGPCMPCPPQGTPCCSPEAPGHPVGVGLRVQAAQVVLLRVEQRQLQDSKGALYVRDGSSRLMPQWSGQEPCRATTPGTCRVRSFLPLSAASSLPCKLVPKRAGVPQQQASASGSPCRPG